MSVIWLFMRYNEVNEVSADSGARSVIWFHSIFNSVNKVSGMRFSIKVLWVVIVIVCFW